MEKVLDLGCGRFKVPNTIGVDIVKWDCVDVVHDLNVTPYPFHDSSIDKIYCTHVLEHVDDLVKTMHELYRVLKPGGTLVVRVPHASCCTTAWADPTHKRFFVHRSFEHFDSRFNYYGFKTDFTKSKVRLHYYILNGIKDGKKITRMPIWIGNLIDKVANINSTTQVIFERLFVYWIGGFEECYFELTANKEEFH